jgi:hypothetical protein
MINTLAMATIFMQALDQQMIEGATSGWMESNAGQVKYSGGDTVKIPMISMDGLGNYDRDDGYVQGGVSLSYGTYQLTQDRGRKFQLDAMEVDESNFVATAGNVMGEFQRTKVIPEVDAYRYSKLAALAIAAGNTVSFDTTATGAKIFNALQNDISTVQDVVGETEPLVVTMSRPVANLLSQDVSVSKFLEVSDFAQGSVNLKVKSLDGTPILSVPSARLKTAYTFNDGSTTGQTGGGFTPATGALSINWIISARRAPIAVSKTDMMKIFDPATNQLAQAWLIEYRKFHELWVTNNKLTAVRVNTAPAS